MIQAVTGLLYWGSEDGGGYWEQSGGVKPKSRLQTVTEGKCNPRITSWLLVSAGRVSGDHLLHPVRPGDRPFPRRHLLVPAEGAAGGALPLRAAEAAAGVARRSAAVQPRDLPVAAEPGPVPVHRPPGRLLHHHTHLPADPLPARLPPLAAAQVPPGENRAHTTRTAGL